MNNAQRSLKPMGEKLLIKTLEIDKSIRPHNQSQIDRIQSSDALKNGEFNTGQTTFGKYVSWLVFILGLTYALITIGGILSIASPAEQIGQPYFLLMELLIILIAPLMGVTMISVHFTTDPDYKIFSLAATCCMFVMATITSSVHFVVLSTGSQLTAHYPFFFTFQWPSIVYALDILAWDWFYALSMFFAATVFRKTRLEISIRITMITSGVLSLTGLLGIPFENMQLRNIGIVGYGLIGPLVFLLIGISMKNKRVF